MEERMWNELNRILGAHRKDELRSDEGEGRAVPLPEQEPDAPAAATSPDSKNESFPNDEVPDGGSDDLAAQDSVGDAAWADGLEAPLPEDGVAELPPAGEGLKWSSDFSDRPFCA